MEELSVLLRDSLSDLVLLFTKTKGPMEQYPTYTEQAYFEQLERDTERAKHKHYYAGGKKHHSPPVDMPFLLKYDGKTNLHNRYEPFPVGKGGPGGSGEYSMKRSAASFRALLNIHAVASEKKHCYFVTHTMAKKHSNEEKRRRFRMMLDHFRKLPGYLGHIWCTEFHADAEHIHHHVFLRFDVKWNYARSVQDWSKRYCDSVNGLDVKVIDKRKNGALRYLYKTFQYMAKGSDAGTKKLPFRWWGTSKVVRQTMLVTGAIPLYSPTQYNERASWNNIVARTCPALAQRIFGLLTAEQERLTLQSRKQTKQRR